MDVHWLILEYLNLELLHIRRLKQDIDVMLQYPA